MYPKHFSKFYLLIFIYYFSFQAQKHRCLEAASRKLACRLHHGIKLPRDANKKINFCRGGGKKANKVVSNVYSAPIPPTGVGNFCLPLPRSATTHIPVKVERRYTKAWREGEKLQQATCFQDAAIISRSSD